MTERIVEYLDALVATIGGIEVRHCLAEMREFNDNGTSKTMPYVYAGNGGFVPVEVDGGSVSYWRLINSIAFNVVPGGTAIKNLQATYPMRFVAMIRRDENNPLTYSQDVANVLNGRQKDLQTQLQARSVNISVGSITTDSQTIWRDEFKIPITDTNYTRSMVMIDLTVTVVAKRECWQDCDNYPDILQGFPWCEDTAATLGRLTEAQLECVEDELCGTPPPVTEQINGTTIGTSACGSTNNQLIQNSDGTSVGTAANPSVVADANLSINGVNEDLLVAEVDFPLLVKLDGVQSGTYDSGTKTVNVTSPPVVYGSTAMLMKTGQTTSYNSGDDGDLQEGRAVDFVTLYENNFFGNTNRFTDELGTQVYTNDIMLDWSTYDQTTGDVLGWIRTVQAVDDWASAISNCTSYSVGSFVSGWYLPNVMQLMSLARWELTSFFNYSPLNVGNDRFWTSNTDPNNTTNAVAVLSLNPAGCIASRPKATTDNYLICRTFNTSEL